MRQAIEEGFIEDVLKNYVAYKTYYKPDLQEVVSKWLGAQVYDHLNREHGERV